MKNGEEQQDVPGRVDGVDLVRAERITFPSGDQARDVALLGEPLARELYRERSGQNGVYRITRAGSATEPFVMERAGPSDGNATHPATAGWQEVRYEMRDGEPVEIGREPIAGKWVMVRDGRPHLRMADGTFLDMEGQNGVPGKPKFVREEPVRPQVCVDMKLLPVEPYSGPWLDEPRLFTATELSVAGFALVALERWSKNRERNRRKRERRKGKR